MITGINKTFLARALFFSLLSLGSTHAAPRGSRQATTSDTYVGEEAAWVELQRGARESVVQIFSFISEQDICQPHKSPNQHGAYGSGFFIESEFIGEEGAIVTNFHVVDKASFLQIQIPSCGKERFDVDMTRVSVSPDRDIALLRLKPSELERLRETIGKVPALPLGNSDEICSGQKVGAMGYPHGQQSLKITQGCVSGRERVRMKPYPPIEQSFIQIDAAINPGNSGGPSLNLRGEVIGVNTAGITQSQNIGWIIPINEIRGVLGELSTASFLRRPFLGAHFQPVNTDTVKFLGNPDEGGFYVYGVDKESILDKAGVQAGDMLYEVRVNDGDFLSVDQFGELYVPWSENKVSLIDVANRFGFSDQVTMVMYRGGERIAIEFAIEDVGDLPVRLYYQGHDEIDYEIIGGMEITPLTLNHVRKFLDTKPMLVSYFDRDNQYEPQLILTNIFPNSQTHRARCFEEGMIIDKVNETEVHTLAQLREAMTKSAETGVITIEAADGRFMVLSLDKVIEEEQFLSTAYVYPRSQLIDSLATLRNTQ